MLSFLLEAYTCLPQVYEISQHLEQIVQPPLRVSDDTSIVHPATSIVTHPVVRNALRLKWKVCGNVFQKIHITAPIISLNFLRALHCSYLAHVHIDGNFRSTC